MEFSQEPTEVDEVDATECGAGRFTDAYRAVLEQLAAAVTVRIGKLKIGIVATRR